MPLEEELVFKIRKDGKNEADVRETSKDLAKEKIFELDQKKIEISLKKYSLLNEYRHQDNSPRARKKG